MATRRSPAPEPADTRERLLQAGLDIARRHGVKALTVRAVAAQAQANLGSFVHHFGTRDAYVEELIERWYAPVFEQLQLSAAALPPLNALKAVLLQLAGWLVQHRGFVLQLLLDAGAGEAAAQRFLRSLDHRHPALLLRLVVQAQEAGALRAGEPMPMMIFLMTSLALPVLMFHLLGASGAAPPALLQALGHYCTDEAQLAQRLNWALRGLAADEGAAP